MFLTIRFIITKRNLKKALKYQELHFANITDINENRNNSEQTLALFRSWNKEFLVNKCLNYIITA